MPGHGERLSRSQEALIAALMSEPSITAAALKVGVNEKTARRWLALPEFKTAYDQARRELVDLAVAQLSAAAGLAVRTLVEVATSPDAKDADKVRAAGLILSHVLGKTEKPDDAGAGVTPVRIIEVIAPKLPIEGGSEL